MAVHLSRLAKYHIADFVNYREVIMLPREWHERHRMPLPEYAMTKEFDLCLRKDVSPNAVEYLFSEGPAAIFWYKVPTGLVSTIVKSFLQRTTGTALRPILCVCDSTTPGPTLLWQELYVDVFPCVRCQRTQVGEDKSRLVVVRHAMHNKPAVQYALLTLTYYTFMREECLTLLGRFEEALIRRKQHLNAPLEPYWLPAVYEPSELCHVTIHYEAEQHAHDAVDVTRFRGQRRDLAVDHFSLTSFEGISSLVDNRKPAYEGIPVSHIPDYASDRWNVYYYETPDETKCLTLFVPADDERRMTTGHIDIHLKRGKITNFA
ncbi:hypothetical protein AAVH_19265 [Aphelenchoides avenae]|nr:hypothetical protein AAVH_19265 [Aphelenchus avenae]